MAAVDARRAAMIHDDPFMPAVVFFSIVALASFAAGWFSQGLLGAF
jgi:hypothetical protein